ncbi:MAG: 3-dehydroquinate synthase [Armatimonadota bacterium]
MAIIKVDLREKSYEIVIKSGILKNAGSEIAEVCLGRTAVVVTEAGIYELYGRRLMDSLSSAGFQGFAAMIPGGEDCKTFETVIDLYNRLLGFEIDRSSVLITLGGGVTGDLGGFAAATYLRGIDFINIPTTLLAQVDASIGGKVGVNLPEGKNLIGAFHQPRKVIIDPDLTATIPYPELASGLAEIIKHGIIADQEMFHFIRSQTDALRGFERDALEKVIVRSCEIKADIVSSDEKESGLRAVLNYGHTVGHGIEAATDYSRYTHGEAVSIGMVTAALISETVGLAAQGTTEEIAETLLCFSLPVVMDANVDLDKVIAAMRYDKKSVSRKLRFILPERIGKVITTDSVTEADVRQAIEKQIRLFRRN